MTFFSPTRASPTCASLQTVSRRAGSKIYRDYDPSVLDAIEQIRGAQHFLRLSLKEIGPLLKTVAENPPTDAQRLEYLEERLVVVRKQLAILREVETHISDKVEQLKEDIASPKTRKSSRRVVRSGANANRR
jgi:MerR family copper efflux transcriptional regulator